MCYSAGHDTIRSCLVKRACMCYKPCAGGRRTDSLIEHQEIYTALQAHAKSVYRRLPAMDRLYVFDGPGFTRETAWVVDGAELSQAPAAVVRLMFNIYADEARFPVVEFYQDRREIDGTIYLYTGNVILYEGKRYLIEQWVDISAYFRK
ncbi:MAG: hypothetical protein IJA81_00880 [Akkermansia sp.]|nr:hypothetical protein [Akkermansia sp.]